MLPERRQALTLHSLAKVLGVQTPSLYNHIDGMPGLLRELRRLNARQLESRLVDAALGRSASDAMLHLAHAYRGYIKEYPDLYTLTLRASGNESSPTPSSSPSKPASCRSSWQYWRPSSCKGRMLCTPHAACAAWCMASPPWRWLAVSACRWIAMRASAAWWRCLSKGFSEIRQTDTAPYPNHKLRFHSSGHGRIGSLHR